MGRLSSSAWPSWLAVFALTVILAIEPVSASTALKYACGFYDSSCVQACYDSGKISGENPTTCVKKGIYTFHFGCICADGTDVRDLALEYYAGVVEEDGLTTGTATRTFTSTSFTSVYKVTTPVQTLSGPSTVTSLSGTSGTSTEYAYRPKSYTNGELPDLRIAKRSSTFSRVCNGASQACSYVCKHTIEHPSDKPPNKNTCRGASKETHDEFKINCQCQDSVQQNEFVVNEFLFQRNKPIATTSRDAVAVTTRYLVKKPTTTATLTAATSTVASYRGATTITTAGASVVTSSLPLTGRIRVDRLDRGLENDVFGYYADPDPRADGFAAGSPYSHIPLTKNVSGALPVTMELASTKEYNVYAIKWTKGTKIYWASGRTYDDAFGFDDCGEAEIQWLTHPRPFARLKDQQTEKCHKYDDDCPEPILVETYIWTLNASQPNVPHPERKIQVPLRPFWYAKNGGLYRPYTVYHNHGNPDYVEENEVYFSSHPAGHHKGCGKPDKDLIDVVHYFEPDAPSS